VSEHASTPSIHVTAYAYGDIRSAVLTSWIDLAAKFGASPSLRGQLRIIREDALISRSRCRATTYFLQSELDVWVQIDHDIQFAMDDILQAAHIAHERQAIVQIPYPCRALPPRAAHRPKPDAKPLQDDPTLTPILFFASGCLAIPRKALVDAIDRLSDPNTPEPFRIRHAADNMVGSMPTLWMPFALESSAGLEYLSEDYAAAARLSLCDVPQYTMQPQTPLQHWGDFNYTLPHG
jgi:hypothetical protein